MSDVPKQPSTIFALIKMARNMNAYRLFTSASDSTGLRGVARLRLAVRRVIGGCSLVNSLRSLDRRQVSKSSDQIRAYVQSRGPRASLILFQCGAAAPLVQLLLMEGLRNTAIVANALVVIHASVKEVDNCVRLSQVPDFALAVRLLCRHQNDVLRALAGRVVCELFENLSNAGMESCVLYRTPEEISRASSVWEQVGSFSRGESILFPSEPPTISKASSANSESSANDDETSDSSSFAPLPKAAVDDGWSAGPPLVNLLIDLVSVTEGDLVTSALSCIATLCCHHPTAALICSLSSSSSLLLPLCEHLRSSPPSSRVLYLSSLVCSNLTGVAACGGSRSTPALLKVSRSADLLGHLRDAVEGVCSYEGSRIGIGGATEEEGRRGGVQGDVMKHLAKGSVGDLLNEAIFDMYCSLQSDRKRYHGPGEKKDDALLQEANR